jgi:VCBS repeat-containing protein
VVEAGVRLGGDDPAPGDPTTSGTLGVTVIAVNGQASNVGHEVTGIYGTITIGSDGSYEYKLDNTDPDTNALPVSSAEPDTFTVTLSTGVTQPLIITVFGNNDIPPCDRRHHRPAAIESGVNPGNTPFAGNPLPPETCWPTTPTQTPAMFSTWRR